MKAIPCIFSILVSLIIGVISHSIKQDISLVEYFIMGEVTYILVFVIMEDADV